MCYNCLAKEVHHRPDCYVGTPQRSDSRAVQGLLVLRKHNFLKPSPDERTQQRSMGAGLFRMSLRTSHSRVQDQYNAATLDCGRVQASSDSNDDAPTDAVGSVEVLHRLKGSNSAIHLTAKVKSGVYALSKYNYKVALSVGPAPKPQQRKLSIFDTGAYPNVIKLNAIQKGIYVELLDSPLKLTMASIKLFGSRDLLWMKCKNTWAHRFGLAGNSSGRIPSGLAASMFFGA